MGICHTSLVPYCFKGEVAPKTPSEVAEVVRQKNLQQRHQYDRGVANFERAQLSTPHGLNIYSLIRMQKGQC